MSIDIPFYIRQVLREQREVFVPGVGQFLVHQTESKLLKSTSKIVPPKLYLSFTEAQDGNDALLNYLIDTELFSNETITKALLDFQQKVVKNLLEYGKHEVSGIGVIEKTKDQLSLLYQGYSFSDEYENLPVLDLVPVNRFKETKVMTTHTDTSNRQTTASTNWWYPILAGILIAGLFIFVKKGCYSSDDTHYDSIPTEILPTDQSNDSVLDAQYEEVDKLIGLDEIDPTDISNEDSKVLEKSTPLNKTKNESEFSDIIPKSGKCIVILGSFKRSTNAVKMMSKVERRGLQLYTTQHGNLTRVGFTFDCSGMDLDKYLNDLRDTLSKDAWYLDPIVTIPYK